MAAECQLSICADAEMLGGGDSDDWLGEQGTARSQDPSRSQILEWGSPTGRHACTIYYCSRYACSPASCTWSPEAFVAVRGTGYCMGRQPCVSQPVEICDCHAPPSSHVDMLN